MHTEFAVDKESCLSLCKKFEGCNWYSFDFAKDNICQMFETCPEIDSNWLFVSGQKECENDYDSGKQYFLPIEYYYRNDCISCLPDLITAPELVTALDNTLKILLVTLLYY